MLGQRYTPDYIKVIQEEKKQKDRDKYDKHLEKQMDRKKWLEEHPEDQWIDDENQKARKHGYADDDVRQLMAAVCLQACVDYKRATNGKKVDFMSPEVAEEELDKFFESPVFRYFVNRIDTQTVKNYIRSTPDGSIKTIWKKNEDAQAVDTRSD